MLFRDLKMLPTIFEMLLQLENASKEGKRFSQRFYKCLSLDLKMLLTFWECFLLNWKCFPRYLKCFSDLRMLQRRKTIFSEVLRMPLSRFENASHVLRMLFLLFSKIENDIFTFCSFRSYWRLSTKWILLVMSKCLLLVQLLNRGFLLPQAWLTRTTSLLISQEMKWVLLRGTRRHLT